MAGMRAANCRDRRGMARYGQPIAHDAGNCAAPFAASPIMAALPAGYEQDHPHTLRYRLLKSAIEPCIRSGQAGTMQIDANIGRNDALFEAAVPMRI